MLNLAILLSFFVFIVAEPTKLYDNLVYTKVSDVDGFIVEESYKRIRKVKDEFKVNPEIFNPAYTVKNEEYLDPSINANIIDELTRKSNGYATYGHNKFAYIPVAQFNKKYMSPVNMRTILPSHKSEIFDSTLLSSNNFENETYFNWMEHNVVAEVKDQGACGSCWAFSATGCMEGQYAIKHKKLVSFSEQELVDCDDTDNGCNGGLPTNAFEKIKVLGGIEAETQYPYHPYKTMCMFTKKKIIAVVKSDYVIEKNENVLKKVLRQVGPISIGINADSLQFYTGGIHNPTNCDPYMLDHGVLIVGYGTEIINSKNVDYWIIKNSWGTGWGEKGYFRMLRGTNKCGIIEMASMVVLE
ncbi:hypothetical protein A3Q56_07229 [Intoshia linei]|uniref:Peptidase C1A papain C-terminal domain-containing protein n=1 Tax=Intoshia linei TaxID=1819745 RepID=A0A177AV13_9BILA|nr:hypothetical protein A3Q56_07229 [Intoshia linei]